MQLKEYQEKTLNIISKYLEHLSEYRDKNQKAIKEIGLDYQIDFPLKAWEKLGVNRPYISRKNGLGEYLPNFCLKIPTGGGKTLLAIKTIDLVNTVYMKKTGLILWVVPTVAIYRQTIKNLKDREHPYRQHLDIASGGRTVIKEKGDKFTPEEVNENLVVLMLMLQSSNRKSKETLKVFKDNGGFQEFFPMEDDVKANKELLERIPNLDKYSDENGFWDALVKTSLGNVLKILKPIIILDEGHKAYSDGAQETLRGFNPSMIVELSATPKADSNILVEISGMELNKEEMIKLDLHLINRASTEWQETLLATIEKRNYLEQKAKELEANSQIFIRPISLIQVERTGKEQRGKGFIHSEDVKEYLVKKAYIPEDQIAIKTSDKDELKDVDDVGGLLSPHCPIRYIITKSALQEGWDCPFAYTLTILTNPTSKNALTQLVGRILRQPYAKKTHIKDLDESYVFCFQQRAMDLMKNIEKGFKDEGLGDLTKFINAGEGNGEKPTNLIQKEVKIREKYSKVVNSLLLPLFITDIDGKYLLVDYARDIQSQIDWSQIDLTEVCNLQLTKSDETNVEMVVSMTDHELKSERVGIIKNGGLDVDVSFLVRHILDLVDNPWLAYDIGYKVLTELKKKNEKDLVVSNYIYIIDELRKSLSKQKDKLAEQLFKEKIEKREIKFIALENKKLNFKFKDFGMIEVSPRKLLNKNGGELENYLMDYVAEDEFNQVEKDVALYLESQDKLLFWYRNRVKKDYGLQGWKKMKIYPDFIFTKKDSKDKNDCQIVYAVETKGLHLKNEDTDYKKSLLDLCNKLANNMDQYDMKLVVNQKLMKFEVVFDDEWRKRINEMIR